MAIDNDNDDDLQTIARRICKDICKENFPAIQKNLSAQTVWVAFPVTGWTVLHHLAAASQFLTTEHWTIVLDIAAKADRKGFVDKKTALGEMVWDVFFRTRLDPMPWQPDSVRHRALQLRLALQHDTKKCGAVVLPPDLLSDDHTTHVATFRAELMSLCEAAFGDTSSDDADVSLVRGLAQIGASVPLDVFAWALAEDREAASRPDPSGLLPLHFLCQTSPPSTTMSHEVLKPVFELVVKAYPRATTIACPRTGLLPLSMALQTGWPWRAVQSLDVPQAIHRAFFDASMAPSAAFDDMIVLARKRFVGNEGMAITWFMAKKTIQDRRIRAAFEDEERARISNLLDILLANPGAIRMDRINHED